MYFIKYICLCKYICIKYWFRGYNFEIEKRGLFGKGWKEEREGKNDVIVY